MKIFCGEYIKEIISYVSKLTLFKFMAPVVFRPGSEVSGMGELNGRD